MSLPPHWLDDCRAALGDRLAGVYAVGSLALGGWDPAVSDIDLAVVTRGEAGAERLQALATTFADQASTLPVRKLELVVYTAERVARGDATFSMNLNVERDGPTTVDLDPATVPRFWFVLDVAIASEHAVALLGPPDAFGAPPEAEVRAALEDAVRWYETEGGDPEAALLARSRAEHYLRTGTWASKAAISARRSGRGP